MTNKNRTSGKIRAIARKRSVLSSPYDGEKHPPRPDLRANASDRPHRPLHPKDCATIWPIHGNHAAALSDKPHVLPMYPEYLPEILQCDF